MAIHEVVSVNPHSRVADIRRAATNIVRAAPAVQPNNRTLGKHIRQAKIEAMRDSNDGYNLEEMGQLHQYLSARSFKQALALHAHSDPDISQHIDRFKVYCIGHKVDTATKAVKAVLASPFMLENVWRVLETEIGRAHV